MKKMITRQCDWFCKKQQLVLLRKQQDGLALLQQTVPQLSD